MTAPNLQQRYVAPDGRLTLEGAQYFGALARRLAAVEGKLAAIAAITAPTGGAITDTEARAAINAIIAAS